MGVSRLEALWRELKIYYDWGDKSLGWYEDQLFSYPINYVRHLGIRNTKFLYDHCRRMRDGGDRPIIVEIVVYRNSEEGVLVNLDEIGDVIGLGNVFCDANNEFLDEGGSVDKAIENVKAIKAKGGLVAAGAWGASSYGERYAELFHSRCDEYDIESCHKDWTIEEIKKLLPYNKPIIRSEYFARYEPGLTLEETKRIMEETIEVGAQGCQYYGFAYEGLPGPREMEFDPFDYRKMLEFAGQLCQKLN